MAASAATAKGLNGIEAGAKKLAKPKLGDVGADGGAVLYDADVKGGSKENLNSYADFNKVVSDIGKRTDFTAFLENLMNKIDTCENCINFFIKNAVFTGETGDAVKSYLTDVHITMLSSIRVTAQNLLDNMTLYKAGYYDIDNSTNFKLSEEAIRAFRTKLSTNYSDTESYTGKIQGAVSDICKNRIEHSCNCKL